MNKVWKFTIITCLIGSLSINLVCIIPYLGDYYDRVKININPPLFYNEESPDIEVINKVVEASMKMDGSHFSVSQPKRGLVYDVNQFFKQTSSAERINNYSISFLHAGLSEWAFKKEDTKVLEYFERKVAEFITNGKLNYEIEEVDQVPIGICFVNLYRMTDNKVYLNCAKAIYNWLINRRETDRNIIYYRKDSPNQFIDALGMYVPFLVEYSKLTDDTLAYNIAHDNMLAFFEYGVDKETGIPSHGYNLKTCIKVGSSNWGRGIGWYVLAASYLPEFSDVNLDKNLSLISQTQFPQTSRQFDSSTALLFEIYLQSRGFNSRSINFIKPYILQSGYVTECSGDTYDFNNHSYMFGSAEMTNGFFLMLASNI